MLSDIRRLESFVILRSREGLTSFNKNNHVNFSGEKKNVGVSVFDNKRKNTLSQILSRNRPRPRI